jgi:phosphoheptose isomerase
MTLSLLRSVPATAGLLAAGWLLSACANTATSEAGALGTSGAEPSVIALQTSNQSVIVTNNAGKPIEDVLIAIQPVGIAPPFTLTVRRMENAEKRDISVVQFRSNDGTTFSPRLYKPRQVTVTATDIVGKKHEITKPWKP